MNIHENQRKSTNIHKNYTKTDKNYRLHPWDPNAPRNVHPCAYDAYGMTVVEAAACGAPSLLATGAGAHALLQEATVTVEMPQEDSGQVEISLKWAFTNYMNLYDVYMMVNCGLLWIMGDPQSSL